jgi:hypothetical protein
MTTNAGTCRCGHPESAHDEELGCDVGLLNLMTLGWSFCRCAEFVTGDQD